MDGERRRRFGAVVALVVAAFVTLTLLPIDITGPLGRAIGPAMWAFLGVGAVGIPLLGIMLGLAGFERLPRLDMKRAAILAVGATLLVPYLIGVLSHISNQEFTQPWAWSAKLTGWFPGLFAVGALDLIGTAGALLAGFIVLTGVTLGTLAWHPLQRLERGTAPAPEPKRKGAPSLKPTPVVAGDEPELEDEAVEQEELFTAPRKNLKWRKKEQQLDIEDVIVPVPRPDDGETFPIELLDAPKHLNVDADKAELERLGEKLMQTLKTFKVDGRLAGFTSGPTVTQFEVEPAAGVKAGRIIALADDLAITMRATSLRAAPIPGRGAVGVEIPNPSPRMVTLRELVESKEWRDSPAMLPVALGRDVEGKPVVADLARMPHLLVAGATGSGKSIAINTIITALIHRYTTRELRLLMIDPKMVELSMYNGLPHLRHPVVTDNRDAAFILKWAVGEMGRRYALLHANGVRQLSEFNRKWAEKSAAGLALKNPPGAKPTLASIMKEDPQTPPYEFKEEYSGGPLPMIVLIVDELADLMMTVQGEIETPLAILAQKARAIGIHLILATQRPSVNVLTGLIKANFPSRVAFRVASKVDSRTILDANGAEALLGNGDMLFLPPGRNEPIRVQGAYISTEETERVMKWHRERQGESPAQEANIVEEQKAAETGVDGSGNGEGSDQSRDPLFRQAAEMCIQNQGGSTSLLQRRLGVGYGRAARIIDQLEEVGILGPPNGSKPRDVLIGLQQVEEYM